VLFEHHHYLSYLTIFLQENLSGKNLSKMRCKGQKENEKGGGYIESLSRTSSLKMSKKAQEFDR
jgi:hypothetical protein